GVRLLGGFAGTEMDVTERNIEAHPSFLDGDIGMPSDSTDNSYNLLYLYRPDSTTLVDGFTFRYAFANKPGVSKGLPGVSGSALYMMAVDGEAYARVKNCKFLYNTSLRDGGAVYINGYGEGSVAPVFSNCEFIACQSKSGYGGAFCRYGGSKIDRPADLEACLFKSNVSYRRGGAVYFIDSPGIDTFDIVNCEMTRNAITFPANESADGLDVGAALYWEFPRYIGGTYINFTKSKFSKNTGDLFGTQLVSFEVGNANIVFDSCLFHESQGLINGESFGYIKYDILNSQFDEGSINVYYNASFDFPLKNKIHNSKFINCRRVYFYESGISLSIKNSIFKNNHSNVLDLVSSLSGREIKIENSLFSNNGYLDPQTSSFVLTGAIAYASKVITRNTTYYNNLLIWDYIYNRKSDFTYKNCILDMQDTIHLKEYIKKFNKEDSVQFELNHCIINLPQMGVLSVSKDSNNLWSTDPMFVAPDSGNFQLQACSPAINAGINDGQLSATDLLGQPRVQFGAVDIGAIEA
ncbi:MAG: choice-of-anchor Q domain-containing protein, partial [Saprospiraceae bacterium]